MTPGDRASLPTYNPGMAQPKLFNPSIEDDKLWRIFTQGEEMGMRMEMIESGIVWETMPGLRHQELAVAIYGAIRPGGQRSDCECYRALDVYVRFPSGVVKRPDVSIFCRRPEDEEGFVHAVPEAVIEITSPDSEAKDLVSGPPLYLANGVKDVVVLDRARGEVKHWSTTNVRTMVPPTTISLSCGCLVTV